HGHSRNVISRVRDIRRTYPDLQIVAGNIVTAQAARDLVEAGADAVKGGVGPGSICTTRVVTGVGVPQITAVSQVAAACAELGVPLIADGGSRLSGDIAKAAAAGAYCVMSGGRCAGSGGSPGEVGLCRGPSYTSYGGIGALGAMA